MDPIILVLISLAVGVVTVLFFLSRNKSDKAKTDDQVERAPAVRNLNRPRANENHPARNRLRNRAGHQQLNVSAQGDEEEVAGDGDEIDFEAQEIGNLNEKDREELRRKIGTKKLAKLEEKAEKRKRNEVTGISV